MKKLQSPFPSYPGNKGFNGLCQKIINLMPPHDGYAELFLGSGQVLCAKKPAGINIGNDIDPMVHRRWKRLHSSKHYFLNCDALAVLKRLEKSKLRWLIYLDPPYLKGARRSGVDIYDYEISQPGHVDILNYIICSKHMIILSGYPSKLYSQHLSEWNYQEHKVMTHAGIATECLWYNFQDPVALHDYTVLGENRTDRQRIKRKVQRWCNKFEELPVLEQNLIFDSLAGRRS